VHPSLNKIKLKLKENHKKINSVKLKEMSLEMYHNTSTLTKKV